MTVPVGVTGRVVAGPERGHFIRIDDDSDASGGVLIITAVDSTFTGEAWDIWVSSLEEVEGFFTANGWEVQWPGQDG